MSEETFSCGYGAILRCDAEVLEDCLGALALEISMKSGLACGATIRVLEIGMHDGGTAKGIERFITDRYMRLDYNGIDPDDGTTRPRHVPAGGAAIVGKSRDVFHKLQGEFDLVIIDGCHCKNCVILDTVHYATRVRVGGYVLYHDVNPRVQMRTDVGQQYCGGEGVPEFGIAVVEALKVFATEGRDFPWADLAVGGDRFDLVREAIPADPERLDCGMRAYRRVA